MIKALSNSLGVLVDDKAALKSMVFDFYRDLYPSEGVNGIDQVLQHVPAKVTSAMNEQLLAPDTYEEVKVALFQMFPTKSPGTDSFQEHF